MLLPESASDSGYKIVCYILWKMSVLVGRIGWIEYFVMVLIDKVSWDTYTSPRPRAHSESSAIDIRWEEENDSCALTGLAGRGRPLLLSSFDQISR